MFNLADEFKTKVTKDTIPDSVFSSISNVSLKEGYAKITFDLSLYDIESIYSAVYSLLDKSYFFFEGDSSAITVTVIPKADGDVKRHVLDLNNSVINYSFYKIKSAENKSIKELILAKSLFNSDQSDAVVSESIAVETGEDGCECGSEDDLQEEIDADVLQRISNLSSSDDMSDVSGMQERSDSCGCGPAKTNDNGQYVKINIETTPKESQAPQGNQASSGSDTDSDFDFDDLDEISIPWEEKNDSKILEEERKKLDKVFGSRAENGKKN